MTSIWGCRTAHAGAIAFIFWVWKRPESAEPTLPAQPRVSVQGLVQIVTIRFAHTGHQIDCVLPAHVCHLVHHRDLAFAQGFIHLHEKFGKNLRAICGCSVWYSHSMVSSIRRSVFRWLPVKVPLPPSCSDCGFSRVKSMSSSRVPNRLRPAPRPNEVSGGTML